ncbi:inorganic triphosphatase YgiF [Novosphingobium sp. PhB57]|uniref:CYTH and CHAD domain-containing protein n=1 Tax=Novosphingobium sp. PhB57 TaxID=2485107 RepID=UPI0010533583|nr:CHAD domain-containing protein [Novosphingobium sp. PhB57]TCU58708.1 inorganic triphosphatase YgiF [Novosphingobium sp. PhB57]
MTAVANEEAELKLELAPDSADQLEASGLFAGEPALIPQHAIYFDTPDHDLSKAGLSLRVRRDGSKRVQTVKADGPSAGMFIRPEWERPVPDDEPIIDHTTPIPALLGDRIASLSPVFTVDNERRLWVQDGIEITLDRGHVIAAERETPVCEVELELKEGSAAALFALARRIDAIAPVRIGVSSKAERGYRLLGPAPTATKAPRVVLETEMDAGKAFQAIAAACLRHFRLNEPLVLDHRDGAALHQSRVAIRRLRSALTLFKTLFPDETRRRFNGELRWLAGELGKARDLDVLADQASEGPLLNRITTARDDAYLGAIAALDSRRARMLMLDLSEWLVIGDWLTDEDRRALRETTAREFAANALERFRRKVKKGGRRLEKLDDHARHEVRKTAKKLRYATDFFVALFPEKRERRRHKRFVSALEELQDRLGLLNDLVGAPELLDNLGLADAPEATHLLGHDKKADLLEAAAEAYETFVDAKRFWR